MKENYQLRPALAIGTVGWGGTEIKSEISRDSYNRIT